MLSHKASSAVLPHWPTRYLTTMHQKELFINKTYRGNRLSLQHCETLRDQRRLLYNSRESTAKNMEPGQRYEILKIWVPNHGAVNVYRNPGGDYNVDNGCLLEKTRNEFGIEKIRILASDGTVVIISRDSRLPFEQNKYKIEPSTLTMEASSINV
ncbi:PREDICTED: uncharacterized protein LOC107356316 [Acropora digitifera]|uniref:uncharacterized protein LOC107356316 n=1 Tax=Acropora digitifera TaxID=70779 RepID=UPI00077A0DE0|nr:PREDICTED: uncharacterized protein LOC107356316 [Acropora digitifera]